VADVTSMRAVCSPFSGLVSEIGESGPQGATVDLQASIGFYKQASDFGDTNASYRIGAIYHRGREGVPKDDAQAVSWYHKAADAGDSEGMVRLGLMYTDRRGGLPQGLAKCVALRFERNRNCERYPTNTSTFTDFLSWSK
jgi:TPR repeat protein